MSSRTKVNSNGSFLDKQPQTPIKCENCKYFDFTVNDWGTCRRFPNFNNTNNYDWCGEFKKKLKKFSGGK